MPTVPGLQIPDTKGLLASGQGMGEAPSQTNLMMAAAMEHQLSMGQGQKSARPSLPAKSRRAKLKVVK